MFLTPQVKPKMDRVQEFEATAERARRALEKEENELNRIEKELEGLNAKYDRAMGDRQKLQEETDLLQRRLIAADKLIGGLSSENARWQKELENLDDEMQKIIGNCLLSAGFLSYNGPFSYEFRNEMIYGDWQNSILAKNIPLSQPYRLAQQLTNDVEITGCAKLKILKKQKYINFKQKFPSTQRQNFDKSTTNCRH